jgi:hypothetical protein
MRGITFLSTGGSNVKNEVTLNWVEELQAWVPHDYQKSAVKFLLDRSAALLLLDPG